jgi:2-methylisocitrate lyase-like PEP mutase family enzyme
MMGLPQSTLDMRQLSDLGVTRVSVGGSLARAALGALLRAATELREHGTFAYASTAISGKQVNELLHQRRSSS